jgi:hypothetical protein
MPGSRPRTKAAKKRRLRIKEERRRKDHKKTGIPVLKLKRA